MTRSLRRAEVARFRRSAARGTLSYLVSKDDPRLAGDRLLSDAVRYWQRNIPTRRPRCIGCRTPFTDDGSHQAAAFLFLTASVAPTSATVSALCTQCWSTMTDAEIEAAAAKALKPVLGPRGLDGDP
jgi:hypothetical protein